MSDPMKGGMRETPDGRGIRACCGLCERVEKFRHENKGPATVMLWEGWGFFTAHGWCCGGCANFVRSVQGVAV